MDSRVKNILIVCHHYPPHITGVGGVALNQANHLARIGHTVTVITSDTNHDEKSSIVNNVNIIRIKALNFLEKFDAPFPIFYPQILLVLLKHIKKADIVHVHDGFYMSSFFAAIFAKFYRKPLILTQHISWVNHPSKIVLLAEKVVYATTGLVVFRLSDLIMTYNDRVEKFLITKNISKDKLVRLTNGVDMGLFHTVTKQEKNNLKLEFGLNVNKKIVLFVGRFVHKKGFDKVLASQSDNYQIVFVGGDVISKNTDRVIFLGKLSKEEISKVYKASDLFILPSESEGFPLSIQEAMACGLPIITAMDEGYRSYNLDSKLFYMINNPTNESVRDAIQLAISDDNKLEQMAKYSEEYARTNFNWSSTVDKLDKIYDSTIFQKRTRKKIAFVSDAIYIFNKGGKEKRLFDISQRLVSNGYDVTIYCMKWWKGDKILKKDGITYYPISPYYPLYYKGRRSIKQAVFFAFNCLKLINKSFDVIDVDHIPHLVLFTTKIICVLRRKEMIATWHEVWGKKYWRNYLGIFAGFIAYNIEKIGSRLPNKIISVSDNTSYDLKSVLGAKRNIVTIPNGLNFDLIKNSKLSKNTSDIIFAGRLLANKNIDVLLKALFVLKKRGIYKKTHIIGEGPEKENLEKLSGSLGLNDQVVFFNFFENHPDLYSMIKSSKVFVLPSTREGFGIAVIEANACGLPVITINHTHNAAKDLIINEENGIVCDLDENSLADALEKVLNLKKSPEDYMKYSEKYDWDQVFPVIKEIYENKSINLDNLEKNIESTPRLTVVCSYFYPKIGGLETIAYTTAKKLYESGEYKVSVITTNYDGTGYKKENIDGMVVHRLPIWFKLSNTPINFMWFFWIKRIFREEKTNIIHTHSPVPFMVDIAVRIAKNNKIPAIVTYHSGSMKKDSWLLDPIIYLYEEYFLRKLFRIATAVVTVHKAFMNKNYPEVALKTHFIPTGVDLERFRKKPFVKEALKVTFIGRIEHSSKWKGISQLLEAMAMVLKEIPNARLELVGSGDALDLYRKQAKDLGIDKSVSILGQKHGSELVDIYEKTSVVVLPSISDSEAFSVTLVEAMASGRPIIGTNIGGTPQVIENEKNGLLIEPKNPQALSNAILRILNNPDFAKQLGDEGALRSREFSWDIQVSKYNALLKEILK